MRARKVKRARLAALEKFMEGSGLPTDVEKTHDDFTAWKARAALAANRIEDPSERNRLLVIALRHLARHRGWRSPWVNTKSLLVRQPSTEHYDLLKERVERKLARKVPDGLTVAQLICTLNLDNQLNLRRNGGESNKSPLLPRLMQTDQVTELRTICEMQGLGEEFFRQAVLTVFDAKSPRGAASKRAGKDALPGQEHRTRAPKSDPAFQIFRIVSTIANLRIRDDGDVRRPLNTDERRAARDLLLDWNKDERPTWQDVAQAIGVERTRLVGTGVVGEDGERVSGAPRIDVTNASVLKCKVKKVLAWWQEASEEQRSSFILAQEGEHSGSPDSDADVDELLEQLSDEELVKIEKLALPQGRSAYSRDSLKRLTRRMEEDGCDLYEARQREFGVPPEWQPPADPIYLPTGNPAVDRVLKAVNRWILMAEHRWGPPQRINIEHVRSGFVSEAQAREILKANDKAAERNRQVKERIKAETSVSEPTNSDVRRYRAIQRQNGECLYCGESITFNTCEMDHIVPRKGEGSTNTRDNLVAVCAACNRSKTNTTFAHWAESSARPGVSLKEAVKRVSFWIKDPDMSKGEFDNFKRRVVARLKRTDFDPPFDGRSMESVAWMARETAHRIRGHFANLGIDVKVDVFRGAVTAEARKASGFEKRIRMIGGTGKNRLDRRHHAIDAAVIAMMRQSVAQTLSRRSELRRYQEVLSLTPTWKTYQGQDFAAQRIYRQWLDAMDALVVLCQNALDHDEIPVHRNLRLSITNGSAHKAEINKLLKKKLSDAWTLGEIDRVANPAAWCALTGLPEFVWKKGLPADPMRTVRINGRLYRGTDTIPLFSSSAAQVLVRGGSVSIGNSIHHARIYSVGEGRRHKYYRLRVFAHDLRRCSHTDVFSYELPQHAISMRDAHINLRSALREGTAVYLGWLTYGDEVVVEQGTVKTGMLKDFLEDFPQTQRWQLVGMEEKEKFALKPLQLSAEGLNEASSSDAMKIIKGKGWRTAVNPLFAAKSVTIIRRDAHGRPRWRSSSHLPVSWRVVHGDD